MEHVHLGIFSYLFAVRNSPAGVALGKVGAGMPGENDAVVALRLEAEVRCPPPSKRITPCAITQSYCLFNITADPCELDNLGRDSIKTRRKCPQKPAPDTVSNVQ